MKDDYKQISKIYDLLSSVYSLGAVDRCRHYALTEVLPGIKVCFLGVGQGKEAVKAIEMGAEVTVVDTSLSMLEGFQARLGDANIEAEVKIECGDVMDFCRDRSDKYDLVVAHFFLNVFAVSKMPEVLEKVLDLCSDDGQLIIGDFWQNKELSKVVQWIQLANWNTALFIFRRIANNPKHSIYIYDGLLEKFGFNLVKEKTFNVLGIPMYRSIIAKNNKRPCERKKE